MKKLHELLEPYLSEMSKINAKWNFCSLERRSEVDNERWIELDNIVTRITTQFDEDNPMGVCDECGDKLYASHDGVCTNFGVCTKAPKYLGG